MTKEEFVAALISASDAEARRFLREENSEFLQIETVYALKERADNLEQDDARRALEIGQIAEELAESIEDNEARGVALWTQANAQDYLADLENAVPSYERAAHFFWAAGKPLQASRTSIGHMEALAKLGRFDEAQLLAEAARHVFVEFEDLTSLAKIDMNLGNLYYRRGDYPLALESYRMATQTFETLGNDLYAAMNQINQANMLNELDDFLHAEQLYQQARPVFENAGFRTAVASVDLDQAIFQSYRGNYSKAFQMFEQARAVFSSLEMHVNVAMTNLEESDLYLDLNLPTRAFDFAERAQKM